MSADLPDVPGYEIQKVLGRGGFASVYLARQVLLDRLVALKVMDPALARDREFCERFVREARDTAGLGDHANIVTVHDVGRVGDFYYIALQYLPGPNLSELLEADEPYQHPLHIIERIAGALAYAHARGFVHRDIKPANILFNEANEAVLSDFGIAKSLGRETQLTVAGSIIGTARYMSPEQAMGRDTIDCRSDLYSLGVMFFELLTRSPPYVSSDPMQLMLKHIHEPVPTLPESEAIYQPLIDRMMAKRPEDRYDSGEALLDDIASYMETGEATSHGAPVAAPPSRRVRRSMLIGGAVLASAIVGTYVMTDAVRLPFGTPGSLFDPSNLGLSDAAESADSVRDAATERTASLDAFTADPDVLDAAVNDLAAPGDVIPDAAARDAARPVAATVPVTPDVAATELASRLVLSDVERERMVRLLDVAELHELVGRVAEPPGSNAIEAYELVLEIDPNNALALGALSRLRNAP